MHSHTISSCNKKEIFELIYQLAKAKNQEELEKLVKSGVFLNLSQGVYTPVALLAKEGDKESVEFLINKFRANRDQAVYGYAMGGHVRSVNEQIEQGASRDDAAGGYALGGYVDQVNEQISLGASRDFAIWGYAHGGYVEQVNEQISLGASRDFAIWGYAMGEHINQVSILFLMACTHDVELRDLLARKAKEKDDSLDINALQKKATTLNKIMREYQLDYKQAQSLTIRGVREWLLQCPQLVIEKRIPKEIYSHITFFLSGLSGQDAKKVYTAVSEKLFLGSAENIFIKYKNKFFTNEEYLEERKKAKDRYRKRQAF